ncbi:hypothetical protein [Chryseobacterium wangxinyae]|uniref:hypothetical protein n=1 Tax=Chryseobacterium sp. CY353 TaxID=2997334 RepID=UPI0022715C19|nr:hypothetical protein [Chryseobacterium sp. CY353]MCY0968146.1 hypothetical protein [Chryseobacterium sp. CY353]
MEKLIILISLLVFTLNSSQRKKEKLNVVTENVIKLYLKDTLKKPFKYGDYISVSIFSDSTSNKNLYIETLEKDFELFKNTEDYKWFTAQGKKIIIFCDFGSSEKCKEYFNTLSFINDEDNSIKFLDQKSTSYELDGDIRLWKIKLNVNNKVTNINGKIIEAEIAHPKVFKKFLKKHSVLKLYQLEEGGNIIPIKKNK